MGRTPDENEPRDAVIIVRVLEDERERWRRAAAKVGLSLSAWIRKLANEAAPPKTKGKRG